MDVMDGWIYGGREGGREICVGFQRYQDGGNTSTFALSLPTKLLLKNIICMRPTTMLTS
jgi:hypothetical protein